MAKKKRARGKDGRFLSADEPRPRAKPSDKRTPEEQKAHDEAVAHRKAQAVKEIQRRQRRAAQDISPLPPPPTDPVDIEERARSDESLRDHLLICYPEAFPLPFGEDHDRLIADIETAIVTGGLKALAMPRGSGKTTIIVRAAIWAILTNRRRFVGIVAAIKDAAVGLLDAVKTEILTNPNLARLYPQEIYALRRLEGESRLAGGQRFEGELTGVEWKETRIQFGHVPGVESSGAILYAVGITGNIRGPNITLATGEVLRPDLLLVDDIQTRESAQKDEQNNKRHRILMGDALGVSGPDRKIAALVTGTVIYKNDAMDRLLDRKVSPMWNGDKCQMVYAWPEDEKPWDEFRAILEAELAAGDTDHPRATQFVRDNFEQLHKGSRVGWTHRYNRTEASALQHGYTLRFRDEETFWAEYNNTPLSLQADNPYELDAQALQLRMNQCVQWEIPAEVEKLTAFVDVQKRCLFWMVLGWEMCGRGHVLAYGTYPDQGRLFFSKQDIHRTLEKATKTNGVAESIWAGLTELVAFLMDREFVQEGERRGDVVLEIGRLGIDARWGDVTDLIRRFCRESKYRSRLVPMFGHYIGAKSLPWQRWKHGKRDIVGRHCKMVPPPQGRGLREMIVDVNWWKTFTAEKLDCLPGADHSIQFHRAADHFHRMLAAHCTAEESETHKADSGTTVIEWTNKDKDDEDLWDCLVGATVLSYLEGVKIDPRITIKAPDEPETDRGEEPDEPGAPPPDPEPNPTSPVIPPPITQPVDIVRPVPRGTVSDDRVQDVEW